MNHELVMLRGIEYCKNSVKKLNEQCLRTALGTFSAESYREGTMGQARDLAEICIKRDKFCRLLELVKTALKNMPKGYRALIISVYIKKTPKEALCAKYGVSLSTVYRKLNLARECFKSKLLLLGCDEQWFADTYGNTEWVNAMLLRSRNGARITT